jgi:TetR/AcrR family transcriptional regulator, mexJK operon transcriptional repressor
MIHPRVATPASKDSMTVKDQSVPIRETSAIRTTVRQGPGRPTLSNEELLDKALDLFLEKGFERTTIDAITATAGMAKRTVYLRYGDKTALFKAALQRAIEEWIVPIERLRAAESDDLEETLLKVGQILVANLMTPAGLRLLRITNAESGRMPEIGAYAYRHGTEPTVAYLADLFRRRIPFGLEVADATEAAVAFLYLVGGPPTMTAWGLVLDDDAIDRHTRYCVRLFLYGLLSREAAGESPRRNDRGVQPWQPEPEEIGMPRSQLLEALETENRRLKKLLLDSMLQAAALKERRGNS